LPLYKHFVIANMVDDLFQAWSSWRQQRNLIVVNSGMFGLNGMNAAAQNWNNMTKILELAAQRVDYRVNRKMEDIKSERDGVSVAHFSCCSV
jgi:hypothetical protein